MLCDLDVVVKEYVKKLRTALSKNYYNYIILLCNLYKIQVNEKFYKLERRYRDCIKRTRDKTRTYSILHDAPQALDDSDQTRKYGISDP